jgi:lipoprotein NlpD
VRKGDTLFTIAFRHDLDHRDLAGWNGIKSPYVIYPDQLLRLTPASGLAAGRRRGTAGKKPAAAASPVPGKPSSTPSAAGSSKPADIQKPALKTGDPVAWIWPVEGRLLRGFMANDPSRNGLDIAGRDGQSVRATAAGIVVYSGNGLIGFGELIIIKHSERMLSAYAHNRVRLVQEGARVEAGQKVAEVGRNDRNEPILHFEIRVNGRPVDPRQYLPAR